MGEKEKEQSKQQGDQNKQQGSQNKQQKGESIKETLKEYARGCVGGILFSLPLLYTMEMWWRGFTADPHYLLISIIVTFLLLLGYNRYAGMRQDSSWGEIIRDSFEELGLGIILTFLILWLLNRIDFDMPTNEILGKVVIESMIVSIGLSVGTAQLGGGGSKGKKGKSGEKKGGVYDVFHDVTLSTCGAVLFASSVAPTMEIKKLALSSGKINILILALISIALSTIILFFSNFKGAAEKRPPASKMIFDLVVSYSVALVASLGMMWFFGRIEGSLILVASEMIVLGLPASIGSSAGRLLISG